MKFEGRKNNVNLNLSIIMNINLRVIMYTNFHLVSGGFRPWFYSTVDSMGNIHQWKYTLPPGVHTYILKAK